MKRFFSLIMFFTILISVLDPDLHGSGSRRCTIFFLYLENDLFVSVVSIRIRNTETNRKFIFWFRNTNQKSTETDWASFVSVKTEFFWFVSWTLVVFKLLFSFFRFVSKQIYLIRLFRNGLKIPKQTKTNQNKRNKILFCFIKQTENQPKQI
jgi:hypothetical protein